MHQHPIIGYIIGMILLDLEIIDLDRAFEQLVLDFFDNDVFSVDEDENITRAEVRCIRPALDRTIERVRRRGNNFLAVDKNVRQLGCKVLGGFPPNLCAGDPTRYLLLYVLLYTKAL